MATKRTYAVVDEKQVKKIKAERERLRANAKDFAHVPAYDRIKGVYLSDPSRKAVLFQKVETVCKIADVTGVTAKDREYARRAVELLTDTFLIRTKPK